MSIAPNLKTLISESLYLLDWFKPSVVAITHLIAHVVYEMLKY